MAPEPILCFDGDSAGRKAAHRAIDTVLPHLKPGTSVRFAFLPDTFDPDDLIRQEGPAAMEAVLVAAKSLADVLWDREWGQDEWSTPERRAKLEQQMFALVRQIEDQSVRSHYVDDVRTRLARAFGRSLPSATPEPFAPAHNAPSFAGPDDEPEPWTPDQRSFEPEPWQPRVRQNAPPQRNGQGPFQGRKFQGAPQNGYQNNRGPNRWSPRGGGKGSPFGQPIGPQPASDSLKNSSLGSSAAASGGVPPREILLLRILLNHPWMLEEHSETIADIAFSAKPLERLRDALLVLQSRNIPLDSTGVRTQLTGSGFTKILTLIDQHSTHKSDRFAEPHAARDLVEEGWRDVVRLQMREVGMQQPLREAERAWFELQSEEASDRIVELLQLRSKPVGGDDKSG
jgi:DNA primase